MTKTARAPKPPRTYTCRFCQDLVVRHERMIHFERKPTTRMTSRKARKYEPRRESQSSDAQESVTVSSETTSERKLSIPTPTVDAAAAKKTAAEALSAAMLQGIPNLFDDITPLTPKTIKRRASDDMELNVRPTKLQILDQTLTSPASIAPVAPMFGRATAASGSGSSSTAISPTSILPLNTRTIPDTSSIFPGFAIDPLLQDPEFDAQLDDETAEDTLRMFTHAEQQLFSPPLSDSASDSEEKEETTRVNEDYLRDTATEAWKLQLEEAVKVAS
ncbi:hypothetical protein H072_4128 [Dactylellina haptotyla CBS 200.50]|uniref:Uncharacterized protein n=1 Tax=Dactylellina haptotyla (strain CBS 200.50) TaxID=1284197 RepID=S8ALF2_DACHA|nr:hypothetical protein H072_4128 [Dactylellina haptotyla CBS 200.50]